MRALQGERNPVSAFGIEAIPHPRLSSDIAGRGFVGLKLLSQVANEDAKILGLLGGWGFPHNPQQCAVRHHTLGMPRKVSQNVKLFRGEPYFAAFDLDAVGLNINMEMTNVDHIRLGWLCC